MAGNFESIHSALSQIVENMKKRYQQMSLERFESGSALNDFLPRFDQEKNIASPKV